MIPEIGQRLGPYEILGRLGGGGMGHVFRAWDARLQREVAVKLLHDDYTITAIMMTVDPTTVRMKQRIAAGKFSINGVELAPTEKTIAMGKKLVDFRAEVAVKAIRKAIASGAKKN